MTKNAIMRLFIVSIISLVAVVTLTRMSHAYSMRNGFAMQSSVTGGAPGEVLWTYYETTEAATTSCTSSDAGGCDNGGNGDNILRLVNPNGNANAAFGPVADVCAMIYVFDDNQEMGECCGCPLSPSDFESFSVERDLTANFLLGGNPNTTKVGAIAVVAADSNIAYVANGAGSDGHNCA